MMLRHFLFKQNLLGKLNLFSKLGHSPLVFLPLRGFMTCNRTPETRSLIQFPKYFMRSNKTKRKLRMPDTKYKYRTHHGMRKRIRIIGPRWNRCFKFYSPGHQHKMTNKSRANLIRKKKPRFICKADLRHVKRMLPYFKRKKYKH